MVVLATAVEERGEAEMGVREVAQAAAMAAAEDCTKWPSCWHKPLEAVAPGKQSCWCLRCHHSWSSTAPSPGTAQS